MVAHPPFMFCIHIRQGLRISEQAAKLNSVECSGVAYEDGTALPLEWWRLFVGKLGAEFDVARGQEAARICALNLVAQLRGALAGDVGRVVLNAASRGVCELHPRISWAVAGHARRLRPVSGVFGEAGRHTRMAVGVNVLPYNVAVEVEAVVEIAPAITLVDRPVCGALGVA